MIDYRKLKKHCSVKYNIGKNTFKVGNLSDTQLELAKKIIISKKIITFSESTQLEAIIYIINYRRDKAIEKLLTDSIQRRINYANKKADIIINWINTNYK